MLRHVGITEKACQKDPWTRTDKSRFGLIDEELRKYRKSHGISDNSSNTYVDAVAAS
jgi:hypothetical protein